MNDTQLAEAQQGRQDRLLDAFLDEYLPVLLASVSNADTVGPDARHKLKGILRYYAKSAHPFSDCVRDNMKRFGPGRTEAVCATIKDIIRGTTHWRGHPELDHGAPGALAASDSLPEVDIESAKIIMAIPNERVDAFIFAAMEAADA